jgi:hypothetical protein
MAQMSLVFEVLAKDRASKELDKVGDAAERTGNKGEKLKKAMGVAVKAIAAGGVAAGIAGVKLFNHGAELEAMGNKAATVFGDQIGQVNKWAKVNAAGMGLSSREVVGLAASFGDLLIPMGFTREAAAKMSTDVVGLSGALSQWSGGQTSAAQAADILAKAMLGETDGLKSLGIAISAADIEAQLLKNGTNKLTGAALAQAKATATQELIFAKSTDAQAAYASGGNKLLTAQNTLKNKLKEVYDELSVRLIPVFTRLSTWAVERGIPAAERLYKQFNDNVLPILKQVGAFVKDTLIPTLQDFGSWISRNKDVLIPLTAAFVAYKIAVIAATAATAISHFIQLTKAVGLMRAAQLQLNIAMTANPIGLVIALIAGLVAGLVIAYKRSETFRDIVNGALAAVKGAFISLASGALGVIDKLLGGYQSLAAAAGKLPGPLGAPFRAAAEAIGAARGKVQDLQSGINSLKDKNVTVQVTTIRTEIQRTIVEGQRAVGKGLQARAGGGPVSAFRPYLVGELGPELIVPRHSGYVLTADQTSGLGRGGNTYNYQVNTAATDAAGTAQYLKRLELLHG